MNLQIVVQLIVAGLITGSIYALLGLGYNVIFSTTKVFNLAQGDFLMLGMMLGLFFIGNLKIPIIFAILIVCMIVALMGVLEERIAIRPVAKNPGSLSWVITTLSYALLLRNSAELIWGTEAFRFPVLFFLESFYLAGIRLVPQEIAIFSITVLIAVSLHIFFTATIYGKAFSAIAQDKDAARLRGINVQKMYVVAFSPDQLILIN